MNQAILIECRQLEEAEALELENIVTPWIARVHAWLAAMTGGLVGLSLKQLAVYLDSAQLAGFSLPARWRGPDLSLLLGGLCAGAGAGAGFVVHLSIVRRAKRRLIESSPDYRAYLERKPARNPRP